MQFRALIACVCLLAVFCLTFVAESARAAGILRVCSGNPRYLTDDSGKPIYLSGSQAWYVINDDADFSTYASTHTVHKPGSAQRAIDFANFLQSWGMNYTRYWTGSSYLGTSWSVLSNPAQADSFAWVRSTAWGYAQDGLGKVNLLQYRQGHFDRIRTQVQALQDRGIYCSIMFFGSFNQFRDSAKYQTNVAWHPWNNINNLGMSTTDGSTFFCTSASNPALWAAQTAFVRKMIDELQSFDNIVWEIMNEPKYSTESFNWHQAIAAYARNYEQTTYGRQHLVIMSGGWSEWGAALHAGAADVISPDNNATEIGDYRNGGPATYPAYPGYPGKVMFPDTDHLWGFSTTDPDHITAYRQFVWKAFARGHSTLFMDNYDNHTNDPNWPAPGYIQIEHDPVRRAMRDTVAYSKRMNLAAALPVPDTSIISTGYGLVDSGKSYFVYQPDSGAFIVRLPAGKYNAEWHNPQTGTPSTTETFTTQGGPRQFTPPFTGDAVLFVTNATPATILNRYVFYNNSAFDGNNAAADSADDGAIATDKTALLPGQTATFANYTSYHRGINGVMIDIKDAPGITAGDFAFRIGNNSTPSSWSLAPTPQITTRSLAEGTTRVTLIWPDNVIDKEWLRITVKATGSSGLANDDVFYFGNAIGETGNEAANAYVTSADESAARNNPRNPGSPGPIDSPFDFNRDRYVTSADQSLARNNRTNPSNALLLISAPNEAVAATFYTANMDSNPGWTYTGGSSGWAWGTPAGSLGDPASGASGTKVVGYNLSGKYANSIASTNWVTTAAINCSGRSGVTLNFWRWLGIQGSTSDKAFLEVSNNSSSWTRIYQNPTGSVVETAWYEQTYDISAVADNQSAVYIRWGLGPTNSTTNYCGWNIDEVTLSGWGQ